MLDICVSVLKVYFYFPVFCQTLGILLKIHKQNSCSTSCSIKKGTSIENMYVLEARNDPYEMGMQEI